MIELDDIQSIVARPGRPDAIEVRFLHFENAKAMQAFLQDVAPTVMTSEPLPGPGPHPGINIGISSAGLRLAALTPREYDALPSAFVAGMRAASFRLGDTGDSAPDRWEAPFVDATPDVHAVVIGFDGADTGDVASPDPILGTDPDTGVSIPAPITLGTWHAQRRTNDEEPFGFRDGISDPVIEGVGREVTPGNGVWDEERGRWRAVRTGEAVLGYVDESGMIAGHPDAAQIERNGSYLVIRKLEQHVDDFHNACEAWSTDLDGRLSADDLAERMVGRHKDGLALGASPDDPLNDFRYGDGGRPGVHISPASHIRRANPRDGIASAKAIVPRHQLFRRGLPYHEVPHDGPTPKDGLLFLACCADLRRQFEFVQSHWLQDGLRFGLGHERDPLIGNRDLDPITFDEERHVSVRDVDGGRLRQKLSSFVATRGGEYFLLPGRSGLAHLAHQLHNAIEGVA